MVIWATNVKFQSKVFDLISFANELTILLFYVMDGYLQFLTDFQMTRSGINSILCCSRVNV